MHVAVGYAAQLEAETPSETCRQENVQLNLCRLPRHIKAAIISFGTSWLPDSICSKAVRAEVATLTISRMAGRGKPGGTALSLSNHRRSANFTLPDK